ncbi:MAG TPA: putative sulfate exporter family transporter [Streptomyces sp.]|nr:putative sulfate exporter family transporter [Streptomyces sp.]
MEPSTETAAGHGRPPAPPERGPGAVRGAAPGLATAALLALVATRLGGWLPVVGGPVFALLLGGLAGPALRRWAPGPAGRLEPGCAVAARQVLQASIVVLGTGLSLGRLLSVGLDSLRVMLSTLAVAFLGAWLLGRLLRLDGETTLLVGVGTGVCGASAIAAVTAVVGAARERVAYAMGTIFLFNVAAVALFPVAGHLLGLSQREFGLWSGTAVNDTSSVVAVAYGYGAAAGAYAVIVKLTRSLTIVPICLGLQLWRARRTPGLRGPAAVRAAFPLFVLGFVAAAAATSLGLVPASWQPALSWTGGFLITVALAGIGLGLQPARIRAAGARPLALGGLLWVAVAATSLAVQALTGPPALGQGVW